MDIKIRKKKPLFSKQLLIFSLEISSVREELPFFLSIHF